jgi:hypothetical protein
MKDNRRNASNQKTEPLSYDEVKKALASAVSSDWPESLQEYVRLTGWNRGTLQKHFPELCTAILARYAENFYRRVNEAKALAVLKTALREIPPPPIVIIAQRIGCSAISLIYHFPDITRELTSRYKSYWHNTDWRLVEARLKEVLLNDPPVSMSETARSLGLSTRLIGRRFPKLTRAIVERFKRHVKARVNKRKKQLRKEIRGVVAELRSEGIYPSARHVAARVKGSRSVPEIRLILRTLHPASKSSLIL